MLRCTGALAGVLFGTLAASACSASDPSPTSATDAGTPNDSSAGGDSSPGKDASASSACATVCSNTAFNACVMSKPGATSCEADCGRNYVNYPGCKATYDAALVCLGQAKDVTCNGGTVASPTCKPAIDAFVACAVSQPPTPTDAGKD